MNSNRGNEENGSRLQSFTIYTAKYAYSTIRLLKIRPARSPDHTSHAVFLHLCARLCTGRGRQEKHKVSSYLGRERKPAYFLRLNKAEHQLLRVKKPVIRCSLSALRRDLSSRRSSLASLPGLHPAEELSPPGSPPPAAEPLGSALGSRAPSSEG